MKTDLLPKFGERVIVAIDLNDHTSENVKMLRQLQFLKQAEVHFVHVFPTIVYTYGISEFALIYPVQEDRNSIEKFVLSSLLKHTSDLFPDAETPRVITQCLFDESPKKKLCTYAQEIHADTIIVMTREKHGIFESSVAQYLARHSKCHIVILKP